MDSDFLSVQIYPENLGGFDNLTKTCFQMGEFNQLKEKAFEKIKKARFRLLKLRL